MKSIKAIRFFAEFTDSNGICHHAVHIYHPETGMVDMMRDVKFPDMQYPCVDAETYKYEQEAQEWKRYVTKIVGDVIQVIDVKKDRCIAKFYDTKLAAEYCEQMNLDDTCLDKLEDDPWA